MFRFLAGVGGILGLDETAEFDSQAVHIVFEGSARGLV